MLKTLIVLIFCLSLVNSELCFKNWRHFKSGYYDNDIQGVTRDLQNWLHLYGTTIKVLNSGFGDIYDTVGVGSYAWILYEHQNCI